MLFKKQEIAEKQIYHIKNNMSFCYKSKVIIAYVASMCLHCIYLSIYLSLHLQLAIGQTIWGMAF